MRKKDKKSSTKLLSFTAFMERVIHDLEKEGRFSTAHVYRYALHSLTTFVGKGEIFFGAINRYSLKHYEKYMTDHQRKWNTTSTYVRALRSVYYRAVDAEIIRGQMRLFSGVYTGTKVEQKRALQAAQMRQLVSGEEQKDLPSTTTETEEKKGQLPEGVCESRDLLSLMLRLQGMPFIDLIHLHRKDVQTDASGHTVLTCHRKKTGTELRVTLVPETQTLIDRYRSTDPNSPFLLRFLDGVKGDRAIYEMYGRLLRRLNANLAKLPEFCGLKGIKVSSYTARHTWATTAKHCHVPEEVISEGLGHSSLEVTRTYLDSFECSKLDRANKLVMACIFEGKTSSWR